MRRAILVSAVAVTVLFSSACGSVSENDVVVRVDDAELDRDTFTQLVNDTETLSGNPIDSQSDVDEARTTGDIARGVAGQYITIELLRSDLVALGAEVPAVDDSLTGGPRLQAEYEAVVQAWVSQPVETLADDELKAWYERGPIATGAACVQHILVAEQSEARAVLDRLEQGEAFDDVAAVTSLDAQTGVEGGAIGCRPLSAFSDSFVESAFQGEFGVPSLPVESEFGHHVVRIVPFDELRDDDVVVARLIALGQWHDVETDPEIGAWNSVNVAPLG